MATTNSLQQEEEILLSAEHTFYEKNGHSASLSEISKILKWSPSKVKEVRKRIENKGQGIAKKDKNKQILMLTGAGMGVIMAGVGAAAVVPSLRKVDKPTTPIIQPSGLPSQFAAPPSQVVVIPERQLIRDTYIERGGREFIQRDIQPYISDIPKVQDRCLELGWEWKDGVCHPPDTGDSMVGVGEQWCQQKLIELKSGDRIALGIADYINQVCVINGNYYNYSVLSDAVCLGCSVTGKECDRALMKCKDKDDKYTAMRIRCGETNGQVLGSECRCPDGTHSSDGDCSAHQKDLQEGNKERCQNTKGTWSNGNCTCPNGQIVASGDCTNYQKDEPRPEEDDEAKTLCKTTGGDWVGAPYYCKCPDGAGMMSGDCTVHQKKTTIWQPFGGDSPSQYRNKADCEAAGYNWNMALSFCAR